MRTCTKCRETKPLDDFYLHNRKSGGRQARCKSCSKAHVAEWRAKNRERANANGRASWRRLSAEERTRRSRANNLGFRFGMSLEDYDRFVESQGGVCGLCDRPPGDGEHLSVDHDHACCPGNKTCGKCIRGLLCMRCNAGLGNFSDDPALLERATEYLRLYESRGFQPWAATRGGCR